MKDKAVLTKTFSFEKASILFPKSTPKPKKTMRDYIKPRKPRKHLKLLKKHAPSQRVKRKRLPSIKSLKNKADSIFSIWIRKRDRNQCVICKSKENIQCGHLIKRGKMSTRYDEINCSALCSSCNYKDNFEPQFYLTWFIDKFGYNQFKELFDKSKQIKQMKRIDYLEIIKRYGPSNPKP